MWPDHTKSGSTAAAVSALGGHLGTAGLMNPGGMVGQSGRAVSPNSGLVHWVSMMTDPHHGHGPSPAHSASLHPSDNIHYSMWTSPTTLDVCSPILILSRHESDTITIRIQHFHVTILILSRHESDSIMTRFSNESHTNPTRQRKSE